MFLRAQHFQQQDEHVELSPAGPRRALAPHPRGVTELRSTATCSPPGASPFHRRDGIEGGRNAVLDPRRRRPADPLDLPEGCETPSSTSSCPSARTAAPKMTATGLGADAVRARLRLAQLRGVRHPFRKHHRRGIGIGRRGPPMLEHRRTLGLFVPGAGQDHRGPGRPARSYWTTRFIPPCLRVSAGRRPIGPRRASSSACWDSAPMLWRGAWANQASMGWRTWPISCCSRPSTAGTPHRPLGGRGQPPSRALLCRPGAARRANSRPIMHPTSVRMPIRPIVTTICSAASPRWSPISPALSRRRLDSNAVRSRCKDRKLWGPCRRNVDRNLLRSSQFVLMVSATFRASSCGALSQPGQDRRRRADRNSSTWPCPASPSSPLPVAPRQIPFASGAAYFELDRGSPHWQQMQTSGGIASTWPVNSRTCNMSCGRSGDERQSLQRTR